MHRERLAALPGLLDDARAADVGDLLDDVQLAQQVVATLGVGLRLDARPVARAHVFAAAQPVARDAAPLAGREVMGGLAGAAIFLTFGGGVVVQLATAGWPSHRLLAAGIPPILAGLSVLVLSARTAPPSLALFLLGGLLASLGAAAIYRTSLAVVIEPSDADDRAGALATFFVAGYAAISLPVVGIGEGWCR